jgi:tetratricopeptide (TPR) repeat protein
MADVVRRNFDGAAENYRKSIEVEATPNVATLVRLAQVYINTGKLDNASFTLDKAINAPNAPDQIKSIATNLKNEVAKRKAAAAAKSGAAPSPAAPAPATPAPAPPAAGAPPSGNQQP